MIVDSHSLTQHIDNEMIHFVNNNHQNENEKNSEKQFNLARIRTWAKGFRVFCGSRTPGDFDNIQVLSKQIH
jgi:hypothetical protein